MTLSHCVTSDAFIPSRVCPLTTTPTPKSYIHDPSHQLSLPLVQYGVLPGKWYMAKRKLEPLQPCLWLRKLTLIRMDYEHIHMQNLKKNQKVLIVFLSNK